MGIEENISLKPWNTFGIDVSARYFAAFSSVDELNEILHNKKFRDIPRLILGGGSNILFTKNFDGLVLKNELHGIEPVNETDEHIYVKAAAGEVWHDFVMYCIEKNYAGIENLSLIPGCVGASPMQNIGAYGVEMKDHFHELEALNLETLEIEKFDSQRCEFGYRESVFKRKLKDKCIILSVTFRLDKIPVFHTSYGAIEEELKKMNISELSIKAISDAVIRIRQSKLPDPKEWGNAGSFFKNPEVSRQKAGELKSRYPDMPVYDLPNGNVKLAAGWLIEKAGWKGKSVGNCGVHKNQGLVLINLGGATGSEIYRLSVNILTSIEGEFGILLEREVNIC
ncbi:MAG: UDP-N-acetylmuramate dehydrogenase [Bacteroidota bacterium]